MFDFDLTEIVFPQKEAASDWRCNSHDVAFPFRDQTSEGRVIAEDVVHLPFEASSEPLAPATKGCAFGTNVMKNSVGKGKKDVSGCFCCGTHEAMQSITNCNPFLGWFGALDSAYKRQPSLAKALDRCIISDASNKFF